MTTQEQFYIFGARWLVFVLLAAAVAVAPAMWFFIAVAALCTWGITALIQHLVHRQRPFVVSKTKPLINLWIKSKSFPSAHASIAFSIATMVLIDNLTWGIIFLVVAALVGMSRVGVRVHYVSDIVVGAILGSVVALLVQPVLLVILGVILF
jgi:membrane-associated phospholipid phosphatase